jgi:hypothetical protein
VGTGNGAIRVPGPARLFPSFFMGGFECSTHVDRSRRRQDFVALTQHDRFYREDYERARSVGLRVVREGLRWYLCERGGRYDFSSIAPMVEAAEDLGMWQINCLLHYGFPDDVDPLHPDFARRFAAFAGAYAAWRAARVDGPRWYCAANEPSMLAFAAGEAAWFAPFLAGQGGEFKAALVEAAVAATAAVRAVDPAARFVSIDPVGHRVPPRSRPEQAPDAARENAAQFEAWDMALGRRRPELGGRPDSIDLIGVNCYPDSQKELGTLRELALDDPRRRPFRDLLLDVWRRYHMPILVAETSARGAQRPAWLRYVVDECLAAMRMGVDLQGVCVFPLVDMREWKKGQIGPWGGLGLWDVREDAGTVLRMPNAPYLRALRDVQERVRVSGLVPAYPSRATATATARPMPLSPPVITAALPVNRPWPR